MMRIRVPVLSLILFATPSFGGVGLSAAQDFRVTSAGDSGPGTLRQAIMDANAHPGPSAINLANNLGTIRLQSPLPAITNSVTLNGGTGNTVSGAQSFRLLSVNAPGASVSVNNLTLSEGQAKGGNGADDGRDKGGRGSAEPGNAIYVGAGNVSLAGVRVAGNPTVGTSGGVPRQSHEMRTADAGTNSSGASSTFIGRSGPGVVAGRGGRSGPVNDNSSDGTGPSGAGGGTSAPVSRGGAAGAAVAGTNGISTPGAALSGSSGGGAGGSSTQGATSGSTTGSGTGGATAGGGGFAAQVLSGGSAGAGAAATLPTGSANSVNTSTGGATGGSIANLPNANSGTGGLGAGGATSGAGGSAGMSASTTAGTVSGGAAAGSSTAGNANGISSGSSSVSTGVAVGGSGSVAPAGTGGTTGGAGGSPAQQVASLASGSFGAGGAVGSSVTGGGSGVNLGASPNGGGGTSGAVGSAVPAAASGGGASGGGGSALPSTNSGASTFAGGGTPGSGTGTTAGAATGSGTTANASPATVGQLTQANFGGSSGISPGLFTYFYASGGSGLVRTGSGAGATVLNPSAGASQLPAGSVGTNSLTSQATPLTALVPAANGDVNAAHQTVQAIAGSVALSSSATSTKGDPSPAVVTTNSGGALGLTTTGSTSAADTSSLATSASTMGPSHGTVLAVPSAVLSGTGSSDGQVAPANGSPSPLGAAPSFPVGNLSAKSLLDAATANSAVPQTVGGPLTPSVNLNVRNSPELPAGASNLLQFGNVVSDTLGLNKVQGQSGYATIADSVHHSVDLSGLAAPMAVPEPSTIVVLGFGLAAIAVFRRKGRSATRLR